MTFLWIFAAFISGLTLKYQISFSISLYRCLRATIRDARQAPWKLKHKQAWATFKWAAKWEFYYGAEVD